MRFLRFLNIWTLWEYLEYEFRYPNPPFEVCALRRGQQAGDGRIHFGDLHGREKFNCSSQHLRGFASCTIFIHDVCDDFFLVAPTILYLVLVAELRTRIQLKDGGRGQGTSTGRKIGSLRKQMEYMAEFCLVLQMEYCDACHCFHVHFNTFGCLAGNRNGQPGLAGLFMALQPRIIACGNKVAAFSMPVRFLVGTAIMVVASIVVGPHGVLLHIAIF